MIRDNSEETISKKEYLKNKTEYEKTTLKSKEANQKLNELTDKIPTNKDKFKEFKKELNKTKELISEIENEINSFVLFKSLSFENIIIDKIVDHTSKIMPSGNKEFLDYESLVTIMLYELNIRKTENEYIDINHRITHLEFVKDKQIICIPIKPCGIIASKKYKGNFEIPPINVEYILSVLEEIDGTIDDTKYLKYREDQLYEITENYLIFDNKCFLPIDKTENQNLDNMIDIPYHIGGENIDNKLTEYMKSYYANKLTEYKMNILLILLEIEYY